VFSPTELRAGYVLLLWHAGLVIPFPEVKRFPLEISQAMQRRPGSLQRRLEFPLLSRRLSLCYPLSSLRRL